MRDNGQLIAQHHKDTMMCSLQDHMRKTSSTYPQIMAMGKDIVPDILKYLQKSELAGMSVMLLLWDILKISPYTPEDRAGEDKGGFALSFNVKKAKRAWLAWGIKEGYITNEK